MISEYIFGSPRFILHHGLVIDKEAHLDEMWRMVMALAHSPAEFHNQYI
jgi:hypothetical protein